MNRFVPGKLELLGLLSAAVCDAPTSARAGTYRVPSEYATIQDAMDATVFGDGPQDTVLVAPGNYPDFQTRGDISACVFLRDGVVLRSEGGSKVTAIDLSLITGTHRVGIIAGERKSNATVIDGFTLVGPNAGGIELNDCSDVCGKVTVRDCILRDFIWGATNATGDASFVDCEFTNCQRGSDGGGAVWYQDGHLDLIGCTVRECGDIAVRVWQNNEMTSAFVHECQFVENWSDGGTGSAGALLIFAVEGDVTISECLFRGNVNDGNGTGALRVSSAIAEQGDVIVSKCLFHGNVGAGTGGGGITLGSGPMTVEYCVFIENRAERGGAIRAFEDRIRRCTFVNNHMTAVSGGGSSIWGQNASIGKNIFYGGSGGADIALSGTSTWGCNVFWANADGPGVVLSPTDRMVDPLFCDVDAEDLTLNEGSPCLPNDPLECGQIGAFGQGCGAVSIEPSTWGAIKGLYR